MVTKINSRRTGLGLMLGLVTLLSLSGGQNLAWALGDPLMTADNVYEANDERGPADKPCKEEGGVYKGHRDCTIAAEEPDFNKCGLDLYKNAADIAVAPDGRPENEKLGVLVRLQKGGKRGTLGRLCFMYFLSKLRTNVRTAVGIGTESDVGIKDVDGKSTGGDVPELKDAAGNYVFKVTPSGRSEDALYPGSDYFKTCQRIDYNGEKGFNDLVLIKTPFSGEAEEQKDFRGEYGRIMKEFQSNIIMGSVEFKGSDATTKMQTYKTKLQDAGGSFKELFVKARKCTGVRNLVKTYRNFASTDERKKGEDKTSFDGKIKCTDTGPETQDYPACSTMVEAYNAAEIADKGITTVQNIDYMSKQSEVQTDTMLKMKDDVTAPLKGQRDLARKQADAAYLAGSVDIAKAGVLAGALGNVPTIDSVIKKCNTYLPTNKTHLVQKENYNAVLKVMKYHAYFFNVVQKTLIGDVPALDTTQVLPNESAEAYGGGGGGAESGSIDLCSNIAANAGLNLIMNGKAKDAAYAAMVNAGLEGIANGAKGAILNDQANKIDDAIDGMNNYKPELPTFANQDVLVQKCQADPSLPECSQFNFNHDVGFVGNNISVGGMAEGTSDPNSLGSGTGNGVNAVSGNSATGRAGIVKNIGSSTSSIAKPSGLVNSVGATRYKGGGTVGGGGGGGGGPSALGGGGGGGGGGGEGGGGGGGVGPSGVKTAWEGTGGGPKLAYAGGAGGGKSSSTNSSENPFAKLFGDKKGESGDSTMDFGRGPASVGSQGANIFGMISNRYQQVSGSKRLLEYEAK